MVKNIKIYLLIVVSQFIFSCNTRNTNSEVHKPLNVLFITADDLNYNSIGSYGNTIPNITPNLDKLAQEGMRFTNAYVNIAVCQPSRQSIMTGRYPHNNGALGFDPIKRNVSTLQEELHKVGYLNGIIGKEKHLKPVDKFYWDFCVGEKEVASGMGIGRDPERYYQFATDFFLKAKKENKPFFLMANSHDPHRPFAGSDDEKKYWGKNLPQFSRKITENEVAVPSFLFNLPKVRQEIAEYYTSVHRCDQTIGAILKALQESDFKENTIVMFISDNGMAVPFAKSNCYLNSTKTPWIVRWPGNVKPRTIDSTHFISGIDYMPTILEALQLKKVSNLDGQSFLSVLKGNKQKNRTKVFTQFNKIFAGNKYPMRSVLNNRYGYIVNFWADGKTQIKGDAMGGRTFKAMKKAAFTNDTIAKRLKLYKYRVPEELYDFKNDPDCLVNLIKKPELQEVVKEMKTMLLDEMKRTNDPWQIKFNKQFMQ